MPARDADRFVIDANVALKAALADDGFADWRGAAFVAPGLLWSEVASGVRQLVWRGEITAEQAALALGHVLAVGIETVWSDELVVEALVLAHELGWAKTYDAEYVALARRLAVPLLTSDGRLAARVRGRVEVITPIELDARLRRD